MNSYLVEQKSSLSESTVLVVDDDPINAIVVAELLSGLYQTHTVHSGEEALQYCELNSPDLILLDVLMDGISGLETCRRLKSNTETQHIPVIFITSMYDEEDQNRCWEAGGVDFVSKPVNGMTLCNRVKAHLTIKQQTDLLRRVSFVDGMTGLYNRHMLDETMDKLTSHANRSNNPLGLIMIDVDWFKAYNDLYGHLEGDECLKKVASAIQDTMRRPTDMAVKNFYVCYLIQTKQVCNI